MITNIYSEKLSYIVQKYKYIPVLKTNIKKLRLFHRYWIVSENLFIKIHNRYNIENKEYYEVIYPENLYGVVSLPINSTIYELILDKDNELFNKYIINSNYSLTGAEIKYWFFMHKEIVNSEKYNGFSSFLNNTSDGVINDDKYYFVKMNKLYNGQYKGCRISLDSSKL